MGTAKVILLGTLLLLALAASLLLPDIATCEKAEDSAAKPAGASSRRVDLIEASGIGHRRPRRRQGSRHRGR